MYTVREDAWYYGQPTQVLKSFKTKTEADQYALTLTLKHNKAHVVAKEYVLEKGEQALTETFIETKVYKSKPKLKDLPYRKIVPLHEYLFYGLASC